MKKILHINLKAKYFYEIKNGVKSFEYRLKNDYWNKRLVDKVYDEVHFKLGYPKADEVEKIIKVSYIGYEVQKIKHELFGDNEVEVYAIRTNNDYIIDKLEKGNNSFDIFLENFIDNNKKKLKYEALPMDIEFIAIQGFNKLAACFWSESQKNSYWCELPHHLRDNITGKTNSYYVSNHKIEFKDKRFIVNYEVKEFRKI